MAKNEGLVRQIFRWVIQYLNILLLICGRTAVVMSMESEFMLISKRLYAVEDKAAWQLILRVTLGFSASVLLLSIPVYLLARRMKCKIPRIMKGIRFYLTAELWTLFIVPVVSAAITSTYVLRTDPWRLYTTAKVADITGCTSILCFVQFLLWVVGGIVGDAPDKIDSEEP